jgi:RHS repeat-associated protein
MSIPVPIPSGRSGLTPELTLAYDSGQGNGPVGIGWSLEAPSITRRTDRGLPAYLDAEESDIYIWSGAEDLVPVPTAGGSMVDSQTDPDHFIHRYRPRVDSQFQRVERWVNRTDRTDIHWRAWSRENVLSVFGDSAASRIVDPDDSGRIFTWLLSQRRDDVGNAVVYDYKAEDSVGVDVTRLSEYTRGPADAPARQVNRYLKRILYGNDWPLLAADGSRPRMLDADDIDQAVWHFEAVLDYGEHDPDNPSPDGDGLPWPVRADPFSTYRAGFEIRSYRLCQRVLVYHHFPAEGVAADALVSSLTLSYTASPTGTLLASVVQSGHRATAPGVYTTLSMPPVEMTYTSGQVAETVGQLDATSLVDLPRGVDGTSYSFTDLDSEGIAGILSTDGGGWEYKPSRGMGQYEAGHRLAVVPTTTPGSRVALMDLAGVGQLDFVEFAADTPRYHRRTTDGGWEPARSFDALPAVDWNDANLRFVDLDGDGCADILIARDDHLSWYPSQGEAGFGPVHVLGLSRDENTGPRLVFADGTSTVYLADMTGDGLSDLVRIRVGDVSYWPNLGRGRFGGRRAMENAPRLDRLDRWDGKRLRLADVDGTGTADIIYLAPDGTRVYRNQCGNAWSEPQPLPQFPPVDDVASVSTADMLGTGTTCLVWSSPLPAEGPRPLQYLDLMNSTKPNLLTCVANNLGGETHIEYRPSTRYYIDDKEAGRPWVTRLPFPVWVVARVENRDLIGRTRYITRYAYHHGYYDGVEREFRGFALVEQWDTEEHRADLDFEESEGWANEAAASWLPPVRTRTWFHTGATSDVAVSRQLAGEYWVPPDLAGAANEAARAALELPDSTLPDGLVGDEIRQAFRALRGTPLRVEVTGPDGTAMADVPYQITEQRAQVKLVQPQGTNRYAVFTAQPSEHVQFTYERAADDPRIAHDVTLEVDPYGNVLRTVAVAYARFGTPAPEPTLDPGFQDALSYDQHRVHVQGSDNHFTNAIDDTVVWPDDYRTPVAAKTATFDVTGPPFITDGSDPARLYRAEELDDAWTTGWVGNQVPFEQLLSADVDGGGAVPSVSAGRLTGQHLTLYRSDDLCSLLGLGELQPRAIPGEAYQQAFTDGLLALALPAVDTSMLADGGYVQLDGQPGWWLPSGRTYLSPGDSDSCDTEWDQARQHFFRPRRAVDPFGALSRVDYDPYDLLVSATTDAAGNVVQLSGDYRAFQPKAQIDANGNTSAVVLDCLNTVAGAAVSGKAGEGDSLAGFAPDLTDGDVTAFAADPTGGAAPLLASATTRYVVDRGAYWRTSTADQPAPVGVYTIARETHVSDLANGVASRLHQSVAYFDGLARTAQAKVQAEPGPVTPGGPTIDPRWVGTGWTIYNNKGKPTRVYEPFFTASAAFEFAPTSELSVTALYDPLGRTIATVRPDNTFAKTVYGAWQQVTYDANDTVSSSDPSTDTDIGAAFAWAFADSGPWVSWYDQRAFGQLGADPAEQKANQQAAAKASQHANTPKTTHLDPLGRVCLGVEDNTTPGGPPVRLPTRSALDGSGQPLAVVDPLGRRTIECCVRSGGDSITYCPGYDMAGRPIAHTTSDGGTRRILSDVTGQPIRTWDARGQTFRMEYDPLRRITHRHVTGTGDEILLERSIYGEQHPDAATQYLHGRLFRRYDGAGMTSHDSYDFKGNVKAASQQLAIRQTTTSDAWVSLDWAPIATIPITTVNNQPTLDLDALAADTEPLLVAGEMYLSSTTFDAMNRPTQQVHPHRDGTPVSISEPTYNVGAMPAGLTVFVRLAAAPDGVLGPAAPGAVSAVTDVDYDEYGKPTRIARGNNNGTVTEQTYDPATHRLTAIVTTRPGPASGATVQDLLYTYDPVGNITLLRDNADIQNVVFFRNQRVDPTADCTYDALYRLTQATGREHLGQTGAVLNQPVQVSNSDASRMQSPLGSPILNPGDGQAMANYTETYTYDPVGNITVMRHQAAGNGWTQTYTYIEPSQIDPTQTSNRLSTTSQPAGPVAYTYDAHGNMTTMPHLTRMIWDEQDQLSATSRQSYDAGTPASTYYHYDAGGRRVRKATYGQAPAGVDPTLQSDRIYLGPIELYRTYDPDGTLSFERETLHGSLGESAQLLVETRTLDVHGSDQAPPQVQRYQYTNHLGTATLELDDQAAVISYEEYFPYGSTAYQAVRAATDVPKRYRYTGKERDEENDLYYHGARYYAPWLGRWTACDPAGLIAGGDLYSYGNCNPTRFLDQDGNAPYEWADAWQKVPIGAPSLVSGESVASDSSHVGERIGESIVDSFSPGNLGAIVLATAVQTVFDVGGGILGASSDPGMVARGILRTGTGASEGTSKWERGNRLLGGALIAHDALNAATLVLGGLAASDVAIAPRNPNLPGGFSQATNRAYYSAFERTAAETLKGPFSDVAAQVAFQPLLEAPPRRDWSATISRKNQQSRWKVSGCKIGREASHHEDRCGQERTLRRTVTRGV